MVHSKNASKQEDYWYSSETCQVDSGELYPCQEIYFKKNTEIPIRYTDISLVDEAMTRRTVNFTVYSTKTPSHTFFDSIPKNWFDICVDDDLRVLYQPDSLALDLNKSAEVEVWLPTPPHHIPGNDTVTISWTSSVCVHCVEWTPTHLVFNTTNFQEKQVLNITRIRDSDEPAILRPICHGGDYDNVPCYTMYLAVY